MIPEGFVEITADNSHCKIAQKIIYSVLHEYDLSQYTHSTDTDLDDIVKAYTNGYFGMIKNDSGRYVGTFGLFQLSETTCEIRKMYLLPEARGNGLGKWMVNTLLEKAKELGYKKVELETASVLTEANGLYRKIGFTEITASNTTPRCDKAFEMHIGE